MPVNKKLSSNIKDINEHINNNMYLLLQNGSITASTAKHHLNKYLCSDDCTIELTDISYGDVKLIYGIVLDPMNLPFELSREQINGRSIWLIISEDCHSEDVEVEEYDTLQLAITSIENFIEDGVHKYSIEDFAIVVGEEIELSIQIMQKGEALDPRDLEVFEAEK